MSKPLLSIIIPVYKESKESLDSLLEWIVMESNKNTEWIIALSNDDESIDQFAKSKFSASNNHSKIASNKLSIDPLPQDSNEELISIDKAKGIKLIHCKMGRSKQMNKAARLSSGDVLIFLHCDTRLGTPWQTELNESGAITWGCFTPKIDDQGLLFRFAESWGFWRAKLLGYPYGDQCIFVTKALFQSAGGYDEEVQFMEDLELSKSLKSIWGKPTIMSTCAKTSSRLWQSQNQNSCTSQLTQSTKNLLAFICFVTGMPRHKIQAWYQI